MDNELYPYSPIVDRKPVRWPGGARIAFYVGLNIEHFHVDKPSTSLIEATTSLVPDPLNHGWRDYGNRVGIWRVIDALDRHGIRASALVNSEAVDRYPQIVEAGRVRDWAWLAHGYSHGCRRRRCGCSWVLSLSAWPWPMSSRLSFDLCVGREKLGGELTYPPVDLVADRPDRIRTLARRVG